MQRSSVILCEERKGNCCFVPVFRHGICVASLAQIVVAARTRLLIGFARRKHHKILGRDFALRTPVPSPMNEIRRPECPNGGQIFVAPETDKMEATLHFALPMIFSQLRMPPRPSSEAITVISASVGMSGPAAPVHHWMVGLMMKG